MSKEIKIEDLKIAVIRIRGETGIKSDIKNTLKRLKLLRKNTCVLLKDTPDILGMLNKCKDYITWGIIGDTKTNLVKDGKTIYRLNPPIKGYGPKGIKKPFSIGGALGNRKDKIDDLIKRMIK